LAAIWMLAYGVVGDLVDDYMHMSESTCIELMYNFSRAVISIFGQEYLRKTNMKDTQRLLSINEKSGFPGMLGSIECMHWEWKNFPFAWHGQYSGHAEGCRVILEAVASQHLWIWHSFFDMAGAHKWYQRTCFGNHMYLLALRKAMLHRWAIILWTIHTPSDITELMVYTWGGLFLWRHIVTQRRINTVDSRKNKRLAEKMWSEHLVFCSFTGPLFVTQLSNGAFNRYGRSSLLVWSYTTWSLRRSVMIVSMIRSGIFRMCWLLQTLDQHPFRIFSMHIMIFEVGQPTTPSMKIWWIIFRFTREITP
jgi:hypothetical protein